MYARDVGRVPIPQSGGDEGPAVAALRAEARIAQAIDHEVAEDVGGEVGVEAGLARRVGEAVAGDGGDDDVEGVGGVAAVRCRVGERPAILYISK